MGDFLVQGSDGRRLARPKKLEKNEHTHTASDFSERGFQTSESSATSDDTSDKVRVATA